MIVFDDLHFLANRLPDGSICTLHTEPGAADRGALGLRAAVPRRAARRAAGRRARGRAWRRATAACYGHVDGPRFNTKAEIRSLAAVGVTAV